MGRIDFSRPQKVRKVKTGSSNANKRNLISIVAACALLGGGGFWMYKHGQEYPPVSEQQIEQILGQPQDQRQGAGRQNRPQFTEEQRAQMQAQMQAISQAIEARDYNAWRTAVNQNPRMARMSENINADNFNTYAEMTLAYRDDDRETGDRLRQELGLPGQGFFGGRNRTPGQERQERPTQ